MSKVRSARGEMVNFDALKIKEQLADRPAPLEVKAREDFVDRRLKRRAKRKAQQMVTEAEPKATALDGELDQFEPDAGDEELPTEEVTEQPPVARKQKTPKKE